MTNLQEPKIIKTIVPVDCPECHKQIFVSYQMMIPSVCSVVTEKDIKDAKEDAINRLKTLTIKDENKKKEIEEWLRKETTLIEPADVDSLMKEILNEEQNDNAKEDTTK